MITINMVGNFFISHRNVYLNIPMLQEADSVYLPEFNIQLEEGTANIVLQTDKSTMTITHEFNMSKADFSLNKDIVISQKKKELEAAGKKVLSKIKYGLNLSQFDDNLRPNSSSSNFSYSTDNIHWNPVSNEVGVFRRNTFNSLNQTEIEVRDYIQHDFQPFIALKHLHRAKNDDDPRFKWIDATIAAELAIKEFFVRNNPTLKTMLLEFPSPPLKKLYKNLLSEYAGEESPLSSKFFDDASRIRNELVHRPQEVAVTIEQAERYVADVERAIFHLLSLLYPDDKVIQGIYKSTERIPLDFDEL
ncbi:hypothetical protein [Brevibacillus reuszeri]|uniref:hypothetical protein n=1 Tax=Brevibacillus reuszeri TaxID=54915 RepID=UPI000CCBD95F|nr:hypothetical protein [Brevibacillus reuszeri]